MQTPLVMTVIGPDRPGLVDVLSGVVAEQGGNWLESRMARLGGQFAGIVQVSVAADREAGLIDGLRRLAARSLYVTVHKDQGPLQPSHSTAVLELLGQDRPGIIRQISGALARHGVNLEELETGCESAPMTGETLFRARAELYLPAGCDLALLQAELERIGADLMVDVSIKPLATG